MRAWRYAERKAYGLEGCRRMGIHAQAARQVGPLFEQFSRIAAEEGLDIRRGLSRTRLCSVRAGRITDPCQASGRRHAALRTSPWPSRCARSRERCDNRPFSSPPRFGRWKGRRQGTRLNVC